MQTAASVRVSTDDQNEQHQIRVIREMEVDGKRVGRLPFGDTVEDGFL